MASPFHHLISLDDMDQQLIWKSSRDALDMNIKNSDNQGGNQRIQLRTDNKLTAASNCIGLSQTNSNNSRTNQDDLINNHQNLQEIPIINHRANQIRNLMHLPLRPIADFTPYRSDNFDNLVQEYCRIQNAHARLSVPTPIITTNECHSSNIASNNPNKSDINNNKSNRLGSFDSNYDNGKLPTNGMVQRYQNAMLWPLTTSKSLRTCKVIVSGDVAVGKTCLVNRFGHDIYTNKYQTTIGVDFDIQKYQILGLPYNLQIWDTAGLERFKSINSSYYRGCHAALLVFDMTNLTTMANIIRWKEEILTASKSHDQFSLITDQQSPNTTLPTTFSRNGQSELSQPLLFLVGTKCDLIQSEANRKFMRDQANKLAKLINAELWFVSSETGENIEELFNRVAALSFNNSVLTEVRRIKFETSTIGASLKEKLMQQQKDLWAQSSRLIKITKRRDGDERRSRCINVQCVIK